MIGCDFTGSTDNRYGADGYDKEIDAGVSFVCKGSLFFFLGSDGVFTRCTRNFLDGRGKEPVRLPALRGQVLLLSRRRRGNGTRPADSSFLDGVYDDYTFRAGEAELSVRFVSPLPPDDEMLLSCPVCYMEYEVRGAEDCELIFAVGQDVCSNVHAPVCGGAESLGEFETAFFRPEETAALFGTKRSRMRRMGILVSFGGKRLFCRRRKFICPYRMGDSRGTISTFPQQAKAGCRHACV